MEGCDGGMSRSGISRRKGLICLLGFAILLTAGCAGSGFGRLPGLGAANKPKHSPYASKTPRKPSGEGANKSWWRRLFAKNDSDSPKTVQDFLKMKRVTP